MNFQSIEVNKGGKILINLSKKAVLEKSIKWWNPGKTRQWQIDGVDLVIGKREGYYLYDMEGKELMDVHLNGGTYNLGHRNKEIIQTLTSAMEHFDIGNHHFPSISRAMLAEEFAKSTPGDLKYSIFSVGGGEAIDVAIKSARYATKRRKIVSIKYAYHGHTGLAVSLGNERYSKPFLSEGDPREFIHVQYNDLDAMESALSSRDVACVIIETIPATYGFPLPKPGYLETVKKMCEQYGTLYVADEVQTGLSRTGKLWGIENFDLEPDILVTAKGLSGGIYPITATIVKEEIGNWMNEDGFAHISTFGGSELGAVVALKVLEISKRPDVLQNVDYASRYLRAGLERIMEQVPDFFIGIRQLGLVMGLEFNHPEGAKHVMKELYENGVWAIYSMLDPRVLQYKPGILIDKAYADELLNRTEKGIIQAAKSLR